MADLKKLLQEGNDMWELTKATGKTIAKRAIGDDSPTLLPEDTQKRIDEKTKPKKKVTNGPSVK